MYEVTNQELLLVSKLKKLLTTKSDKEIKTLAQKAGLTLEDFGNITIWLVKLWEVQEEKGTLVPSPKF
jgi:hypothetical protein